jgi:hypothetical protein
MQYGLRRCRADGHPVAGGVQLHIEDKDLVTTLSQQVEGAPLAAAVYARVETALSPARWLGPLGNYLIVRPAARAAAHREAERTDVPLDAAVVLGVAPQELHVWAADPMTSQVHDHLGIVPLERISEIRAEVGKSWWPLTIALADGESLELSARGDVPGFVAAVKEHRHPARP